MNQDVASLNEGNKTTDCFTRHNMKELVTVVHEELSFLNTRFATTIALTV